LTPALCPDAALAALGRQSSKQFNSPIPSKTSSSSFLPPSAVAGGSSSSLSAALPKPVGLADSRRPPLRTPTPNS
jgi:hypothetical protein